MSYFQYFLGEKNLITILRVLPLEKDIQEIILDKVLDHIIMSFLDNDSPFSDVYDI